MIELDYAYLADFAKVEAGKLTAVGASYTHMRVSALPAPHLVCLGGRVRLSEDVPGVQVGISVEAPDKAWRIETGGDLMADEGTIPYEGRKGLLFAVQIQVVLSTLGLYAVELKLDGELARTLKFEVVSG